jgi:hypothetical protein
MEEVTSGTAHMTWDPASRLATLSFDRETHATGTDGRTLVDALTRWVGADRRPFGLLGDGGKLRGVDAEYRSVWATFLGANRDRCSIAFFNMNPVIRIAADMFGIGARLRLRAFATEADARRWLRVRGITA